ncbi:MAG: DUF4397 domain-containing protein [Planctomycetota bacterium]
MINPRLAWIFGIISLFALITGCSSSSSSSFFPSDAELSFVHASPGAPNVDVAVDGNLVLQDVPYGASSSYLDLDDGNRVVEVFATGTTTPLVSQLFEADAGKKYSFIVYDVPANLKSLVVEGQADVDLDDDRSGVRLIHGSTFAGPVDVYITAPNADLSATDPSVADFQLGDLTPYLELEATNVRVRITDAGGSDVLFDSGVIGLQDGRASTFIAINATEKKAPLSLLVINDEQPENRIEITDARSAVRLFHAISDGPAVDLLVNDDPVNTSIDFNMVGSYVLSNAGLQDVLVRDSSSQGIVFDGELEIPRTEELTFFAVGSLTDPAEQDVIIGVDASEPPESGEVLARVLHASVLAGNVDIYVTEEDADITMLDPTLEDVAFKTLTDYLEITEGTYDVTVTATGDKTPVIGPVTVTFNNGDIVTVIAVDPLNLSGNPDLTIIEDGDSGL